MNMDAYQKFIRILHISGQGIGSDDHIQQIKNNIDLVREKFKRYAKTDEEFIQKEIQASEQTHREIKAWIEDAQIYEIEDKHKFLLMLTKPPRIEDEELWKQVRLPFPEIFIDVKFDEDEIEGWESEINGILIKEMIEYRPVKQEDGSYDKVSLYGIYAHISGVTKQGYPYIDKFTFPITKGDLPEDIKIHYMNRKEANFIKNFIISFLLFIKSREVYVIESERSTKGNERRVKKGLIPLPNSRVVKLTGEIKRYVDSLNIKDFKGEGRKFGYSFWVAGHYRIYQSERYINKKGQIQWIEPYKKGEGIEVRKTYRIIPNRKV